MSPNPALQEVGTGSAVTGEDFYEDGEDGSLPLTNHHRVVRAAFQHPTSAPRSTTNTTPSSLKYTQFSSSAIPAAFSALPYFSGSSKHSNPYAAAGTAHPAQVTQSDSSKPQH
ncbi:hypothetical protein G7Y89_g13941 [Cudoniella acicularis]|uniref:Uncharacterized protein n=1 Tax=Cudoniella acicularis TaxID=354080 RepID=A0A8H4R7A2_9HELO|nr:hypothetical protein G7Y89_g13941 [Cudoniella acicularis]